ncbi:PRP38 family-domain-containing protein [Stachybotrys elegans]|uniref:Pre-mRNA-splicing factor 38 n=1 Tax=Stachybotrys elegans TaxID=80388 RepID=A0A8K0SMD7_9HYPO|nr:PRP38 family-domain-containing protein [Stachybotrys elegans]
MRRQLPRQLCGVVGTATILSGALFQLQHQASSSSCRHNQLILQQHSPQLRPQHAEMSKSDTVHADARRFLDQRGTSGNLAPNGLNPANIMEKAVKDRVVESYFYKEQCFALNEADIIDRVVEHVQFIGGTHGASQKPSPFLCLAFKLLELAPSDEILREYLQYGGDNFKYLRALACFYVRLTRQAKDVYETLEPFLEDRRKLRRKARAGTSLTYVDEFVDDLLTKDRVCATSLWKMPKRETLEDLEILEPRVSPLGDIDELLEEEEEKEKEEQHRNGDEAESGEASEGDDMEVDEREQRRSGSRSP